MVKKLKLGFAMGGGVSLGTFSGSALSEIIKQAILNGGYYDDNKVFHAYESVEVDVFAGASAGSMALAIMLRGMAYQTPEELAKAKDDLIKELGPRWNSLSEETRKNLTVAQVVQNLQNEIWIHQINIESLLGTNNEEKQELAGQASLLRRGALEAIARKFFDLSDVYAHGFSNRRILGKRVVFASTLASLSGLTFDSRQKHTAATNVNFVGSEDAFTSKIHRELRVFDLFFEQQDANDVKNQHDEFPPHWVRYHPAPKVSGAIGNLQDKNAWSRIVATSIACGAFPLAFEPVVLERFCFEYGNEWPEELKKDICKIATEADEEPEDDRRSFPFSYVDGGTFNNEPVREAFRLASFQDSEEDPDGFERVIVFVDPNIGSQPVKFNLPVHKQFSVQSPRKWLGALDGFDLEKLGSLDRMLPHIGSLAGMLFDQSRVNESDKILSVMELFAKKENYFSLLTQLTDKVVANAALLDAIRTDLLELIDHQKQNVLLPVGAITLKGELIRTWRENKDKFPPLPKESIDSFYANGAAGITPDLYPVFLRAMCMVFLDNLINLTGKHNENKIIAIAPSVFIPNAEGHMMPKAITLPGGELEAFAGFTSKKPNIFSFQLGIYCAGEFMNQLKMLSPDYVPATKPLWEPADEKAYFDEYKSKLYLFNERIDSLLHGSSLIDFFPGVDAAILNFISNRLKTVLAKIELKSNPSESFLFYIEVPNKNYEIDGIDRFNDVKPVSITHPVWGENKLYLVTELHYFPNKKGWQGIHVQGGKVFSDEQGSFSWTGKIVITAKGILGADRSFCTIHLPSVAQLGHARLMPNPIFRLTALQEDRDKNRDIPAAEWTLSPGVVALEKTVL